MSEDPALNLILDDLEDAGQIADPAEVLTRFMDWAASTGRPLYPHQEDAAEAIFNDSHVIASTPTGSGKSMIAYAAHLHALSRNQRSFYTAPIKALVSEKFFELVQLFGADNVGMITGDVSLNSDAPIICATAEILANQALRDGRDTDCATVVMDEFHFYADPQRGWAWQVPLLEMPDAQMVLLSATLGDASFFIDDLTKRTGREVAHITNAKRPVPLDFNYTLDDIPTLVKRLLDAERYPMYIVHFSQAAAVKTAQDLATTSIISRSEREAVTKAIQHVRFGPGFGKILSRLLKAGIGVHHAGMLPRYRRLVEQLTSRGLLSVICGTDTLGVGINVPIRCVVLTALAKYDGRRERHLSAREFHQIAGRAGRAGFDTVGYVEVQAPKHDIENHKRANKLQFGGRKGERSDGLGNRGAAAVSAAKDAKAAASKPAKPARSTSAAKKKGREGEVSWTAKTFDRLVSADPEPLRSHFTFTHAMVLHVLSGNRDAEQHLLWLATHNHDAPKESNPHLRELAHIYQSLIRAEVCEYVPQATDSRGRFRLTAELPDDFALNQELSPFALAAFDLLDPDDPDYALDMVSVVESVMEDPRPVLFAQQRAARDEAYAALRAQGADYDQRQAELDNITYPKPLEDLLTSAFATYRQTNPWALGYDISPKSVVRDMIEGAMTFSDFVSRYDLARSEGVILRYLTDVFRALRQIVTDDLRTQELVDIMEWLGEMIAAVDSSLLEEWQQLADGTWQGTSATDVLDDVGVEAARFSERAFGADASGRLAFSANPHALRRSVANAMWHIVEAIAVDDPDRLADANFPGWDFDEWDAAIGAYFDDYESLGIGQSARSKELLTIDSHPNDAAVADVFADLDDAVAGANMTALVDGKPLKTLVEGLASANRLWLVWQTLEDSAGDMDWYVVAAVDLAASDRAEKAVIYPLALGIRG